jgi:hypothetical protein
MDLAAMRMDATWRCNYVGSVYEGDTGPGALERIVIADVKLGNRYYNRNVEGKQKPRIMRYSGGHPAYH